MAPADKKVVVECVGTITRRYVVTVTDEEYNDDTFSIDDIEDLKERIDNDTAVKMEGGDEIDFDDISVLCDLEDYEGGEDEKD